MPAHRALLEWYKILISLRKEQSLLRNTDLTAIRSHIFENQNCMMIERGSRNSKQLILCIFNFSSSVQNLSIPSPVFLNQKIADSSAVQDNNPEHMQAESFIAYSACYV